MSIECAYAGCRRPVPDHVIEKGGRFCSTPCRAASHREQGKAVPAIVQSVSRCADGASVVVVRVQGDFYSKLGTLTPTTPVDLLEGD